MLPSIAKSLTSLEFKNVSIELPPLAVILSLCRNLQVFHQHSTPVNQEWYTGLSLPYTTSLTKIVLMPPNRYDEIPDHEIEALLRCSPALEHLVLDACDPDMVIPAVQLHCHKLTSLVLNRTHAAIQEDETSRFHKADGKLRYVFIGGDFLVSTLRSLLERYHQFLVELYLAPESPGFMGQEDWSALESPVLEALETLGIVQCQRSSTTINDLATIMIRQGRQSIHNLKLFDFDPIILNGILDAIMQVDYLERLTLDGCDIGDLADRGNNLIHLSRLSYLSLYMCEGVTSKFLESVSRITSLNELIIDCINRDVGTVEEMNEFTRRVGELPCLTYLQLAYVSLDCVDIQNLCKSKTLKKVGWNCINIPDDAHKILHDHGIKLIYL
ncbi:hypothetical protein BDC45DRAFT_323632 [Circinella umbellata]|nr:hypothetical protein BDC45DRAFT_323632 [Circinella umbellata]